VAIARADLAADKTLNVPFCVQHLLNAPTDQRIERFALYEYTDECSGSYDSVTR
jgi:hypothetical protein